MPGSSTVNGTQLDQDGCSQPNGQWYFHNVGNDLYEIRNAATGKCISVATNSPVDASMVQWDCSPSSTEYFQPIYSGRIDPFTYYLLQNSSTGKCLNVAGGSTKSGAKIIQWTCLPGANNEQIAITR